MFFVAHIQKNEEKKLLYEKGKSFYILHPDVCQQNAHAFIQGMEIIFENFFIKCLQPKEFCSDYFYLMALKITKNFKLKGRHFQCLRKSGADFFYFPNPDCNVKL